MPTPYSRFARLSTDDSARIPPKATRMQSVLEYVLFAIFGILIVVGGIAVYTVYSPSHRKVPNTVAAGMKQDRVNILVIGIGGDTHPGGGKDLADSIMLVSLKPSTRQAAVMSVPRDLWVRIGRYGTHRLNMAHELGNQGGYPGEGPGLLCDTVSGIFAQPIHAFVRIDFSAFEKVIDDLGGIDVYCQRGFYDYLFRDGFPQGWHHLNGKRALAYARYRYVLGPEGDNFAREMRQQQVIGALRDKLTRRSPQEMMHLVSAISTLSDNTTTNLTTPQMVTLYRTFHDADPNNIRHVSLKPFMEIFDVTRIMDAGEAVRPRGGDYRQLQAVAATIFSSEQQISTDDQIHVAATPPRATLPAAVN